MNQELNADYRVEELSPVEAAELESGKADLPTCGKQVEDDANTGGVPEWYGSVEEGEVGE